MKMYLGAYLSNYNNTATPLVDWFDDGAWQQVALPRLADLAGAASSSGSHGLALDQELYGQTGGVQTATWEWDYPGNTHSEAEVRDAARRRGAQVMETLLGEFPGAELAVYNFSFPGDWNELVKQEVNGVEDAADDLLHLDFWDGMTSVEGYSAIRFYNSIFYKTPHLGTWDAALTHDTNQIFAAFSRGFENWEYASERVHLSPFSWLNAGPDETSAFDDARSPEYVVRAARGVQEVGYRRRVRQFRLRRARSRSSTRTTWTRCRPLAAPAPWTRPTRPLRSRPRPRRAITGTATDNLGIKAVRWQDDQGGSGVARCIGRCSAATTTPGSSGRCAGRCRPGAEPGSVGADRHCRGHQGPHVGARRRAAGMTGPSRSRRGAGPCAS